MTTHNKGPSTRMVDSFGRVINYLRLSVTDRCDLRCVYCMAEQMVFLPRRDLLTIEELYQLSTTMMDLGVRKIRITGGEPLVRQNIITLFECLSGHIGQQLDEVTLTTNATLLAKYAPALAANGVKRVNVSLDTLDSARYRALTRLGNIDKVLKGIDSAQAAGLKVKINAVAMQGRFLSEVDDLIRFAHGRDMDLTLIEEMPMGDSGHDRYQTHLSLARLRQDLAQRWTLIPSPHATGGPARYFKVAETGGQLGFITPLSCDFCAACNRLRVSATGQLYPCLGQMGMVELRQVLRQSESQKDLVALILKAVSTKPKGHDFVIEKNEIRAIERHMSHLGG